MFPWLMVPREMSRDTEALGASLEAQRPIRHPASFGATGTWTAKGVLRQWNGHGTGNEGSCVEML